MFFKRIFSLFSISLSLALFTESGFAAADPLQLPLISINDINKSFVGAFKVEYSSPNDGANPDLPLRTSYANGRLAYSPNSQSVFIDSHRYSDAIAEFEIPLNLSRASNPNSLPNATVIQDFATVIDRANTINSEGIDELGGMAVIGNELFVQVYEYYDAPAQDVNTTLILREKDRLATSLVDGFFDLGGAGKTVNYLSPIPKQWQALLKGDYLAGNGGGIPINGRLSIGPSLYAFDSNDFAEKSSGDIQSKSWLSYSLEKPLSTTPGEWDGYNEIGLSSNFAHSNRLWTENSAAWFGFIPNGTRTFVVLGRSGMHNSGGGYKITQTNGNVCGGPCPYDPLDTSPYYWLYDLKEIVSAKPSDTVLPYAYGEFDTRYVQQNENGITGTVSGGAYDSKSGKLLLLLKSATDIFDQGSPIVSVYDLKSSNDSPMMVPMIDLLLEADKQ